MTSGATDIYNGLDIKSNEIRILILDPGQLADPISCSLEIGALDGQTDYEALSYVWGDESLRKDIVVRGSTCDITENLEVALRHVRLSDRKRRLWVDALCINQHDDDEKAVQVSLMVEIYASASQVLVWLGPESPNSDRAMVLLERMMTAVRTTERGGWTLEFPQVWKALLTELLEEWDTISASLLSRPWWNRAWTLQEFVVPPAAPIFLCGTKSVSSTILIDLLPPAEGVEPKQLGPGMGDLRKNVAQNFFGPTVFDMIRARNIFQRDGHIDIIDLFARITTRLAKDPRDMIYAYRGLMSKSYRAAIIPSYSKDKDTVFAEVIKLIISVEKRVDILSYGAYQMLSDRPTWIADFARSSERTFVEAERLFDSGCYSASSNLLADIDLTENARVLTLRGFEVDKIANRSLLLYTHTDGPTTKCISMCHNLIDKWGQKTGKPTDKMHDELWRVLVADKDIDGATPAPDSYKEMCRSCELYNEVTADDTKDLTTEDFYRLFGESPSVTDVLATFTPFSKSMHRAVAGRVFIITESGFMGLAPFFAGTRDVIVIFCGGDVPYVLGSYGSTFVGECYLSDNMYGDVIKMVQEDAKWGLPIDTWMTSFRLA